MCTKTSASTEFSSVQYSELGRPCRLHVTPV